MKPVKQTRYLENGNCMAACLASLLEVPIEAVDFDMQESQDWVTDCHRVLEPYGLFLFELAKDQTPHLLPDGTFLICTGPSPRGPFLHAVIGSIWREGELSYRVKWEHDPAPDEPAWLKDNVILHYGVLAARRPQDVARSNRRWVSCQQPNAEEYRWRILTGSIGLEGSWSKWAPGQPTDRPMNREYEYRRQL